MKNILSYYLVAVIAFLAFSSCQHDEPVNPIKPVDERRCLSLPVLAKSTIKRVN